MSDIIILEDVTKSYKGTEVVKNVSMRVKQGEIYGFLGPNGAGKTTIMKMILNLAKPDMGNIRVCGEVIQKDSYEYLRNIGSIIEYPVFYEKLTAWKNLKLHCNYMGFYDKKRIREVLDMVDLKGIDNKPVGEFSLGMKQRLGIARAMITNPKLLILDEPINGLDPIGIKQIRQLLVKLKASYGTTILISSHIIAEIEQLADTIGVIDKGILTKEVSMSEIQHDSLQYLEIEVNDIHKAATILDNAFDQLNFKIIADNRLRIYDTDLQAEISKELVMSGVGILNMIYKNDTLEDYFIHTIMGGKEND
ncbi:ABC transporter ATP-binding protein [uncultured Robinsoniella sp.]|uniref:ABC transporter ATP-binding protein n=1 Tax=uncultured Robinsoniella sp. TaxID=904190 RepID=UPI00374F6996